MGWSSEERANLKAGLKVLSGYLKTASSIASPFPVPGLAAAFSIFGMVADMTGDLNDVEMAKEEAKEKKKDMDEIKNGINDVKQSLAEMKTSAAAQFQALAKDIKQFSSAMNFFQEISVNMDILNSYMLDHNEDPDNEEKKQEFITLFKKDTPLYFMSKMMGMINYDLTNPVLHAMNFDPSTETVNRWKQIILAQIILMMSVQSVYEKLQKTPQPRIEKKMNEMTKKWTIIMTKVLKTIDDVKANYWPEAVETLVRKAAVMKEPNGTKMGNRDKEIYLRKQLEEFRHYKNDFIICVYDGDQGNILVQNETQCVQVKTSSANESGVFVFRLSGYHAAPYSNLLEFNRVVKEYIKDFDLLMDDPSMCVYVPPSMRPSRYNFALTQSELPMHLEALGKLFPKAALLAFVSAASGASGAFFNQTYLPPPGNQFGPRQYTETPVVNFAYSIVTVKDLRKPKPERGDRSRPWQFMVIW